MRALLMSAVLLFGLTGTASELTLPLEILKAQQIFNAEAVQPLALEWKVGDNAQYKIDMGFIQGTMDSKVREKTNLGFWMVQDMDMGFLGQQLVEIHINENTGEIIEMRINGEKQTPPDASNQEVVDMKEASITVPAGTFDCVYLKIRDNSNNTDAEAWLNPQTVPMSGMIKQVAQSQMGPVTIELTGYEKL